MNDPQLSPEEFEKKYGMSLKDYERVKQITRKSAVRYKELQDILKLNFSEPGWIDTYTGIAKEAALSAAYKIEHDLIENTISQKSHWGKHELTQMVKWSIEQALVEMRIQIEAMGKTLAKIKGE